MQLAVDDAQYIHEMYAQRPRVGICCRNVSFVVSDAQRGETRLLSDIHFDSEPGTLTAIMGASGAGKSTLLDCLGGRKRPTTGGVLAYTMREDANRSRPLSHCVYVTQTTAFHAGLTISETLAHSIRIQWPDWPRTERQEWLARLLSLFELDRARDTVVDVASGGEQRRLAVALELASLPGVLLLDEPTSGLDSVNARLLVEKLALFSRAGCTIVMTIHQPSSAIYHQLDRVLLMSKSRALFFGRRADATALARSTMTQTNEEPPSVPEQLLALACDTERPVREIKCEPCRASHDGHGSLCIRDEAPRLQSAVGALLRRNLLNQSRDPNVFLTRAVIYGGLTILTGALFSDIRNTWDDVDRRLRALYFWSSSIVALTIACVPAQITERAVYVRETQNGHYGPLPYVLASSVANLPYLGALSLLCTTLMLVAIPALGRDAGHAALLIGLLFSVLLCAESILALLSVRFSSLVGALVVGGALTAVNTLFSGFIVRPTQLTGFARLLYRLAFQQYYFSALVYSDLHDRPLALNPSGNATMSANAVLEEMGMLDTNVLACFAFLLSVAAAARVGLLCVLLWSHRRCTLPDCE